MVLTKKTINISSSTKSISGVGIVIVIVKYWTFYIKNWWIYCIKMVIN